jgi:hypothetical protein
MTGPLSEATMKLALALAAVLLAAPLAARADLGLRIGADATIAYHTDSSVAGGGTHFITDTWPLGVDLMLSYWTPGEILSIDAEIAEQFFASPPSAGNSRIGTVFRPGLRLSPPVLPIYARVAVPINFDQPTGHSREMYDLRLGAGFNIPLVLFKIYVEADADFPLGGGDANIGAFSQWNLLLNAGLDFRF